MNGGIDMSESPRKFISGLGKNRAWMNESTAANLIPRWLVCGVCGSDLPYTISTDNAPPRERYENQIVSVRPCAQGCEAQ